jgi:hypothetical protein
VSWPQAPFASLAVPGVHSCGNESLPIAFDFIENQVLLNFSAATQDPDDSYEFAHCRPRLPPLDIERLNSIAAKSTDSYYHFFVNDCFTHVPFSNGSLIYTAFSIQIDPFISDHCPSFLVSRENPLSILSEEDPRKRPGAQISIEFRVSVKSFSAPPTVILPRLHRTSAVWPFLSLLLFAPTVVLFVLRKDNFPLPSSTSSIFTSSRSKS